MIKIDHAEKWARKENHHDNGLRMQFGLHVSSMCDLAQFGRRREIACRPFERNKNDKLIRNNIRMCLVAYAVRARRTSYKS